MIKLLILLCHRKPDFFFQNIVLSTNSSLKIILFKIIVIENTLKLVSISLFSIKIK